MIKNLAVSLVSASLVVFAALEWRDARQGQPQPFSQFCMNASDGRLTCRVSLLALAFDPSTLGDRLAASQGVLVVDNGYLSIYHSTEAFRLRDRRLALRVKAPEQIQRQLVRDYQGKTIDFRGRVIADEKISLRYGFMAAIADLEVIGPAFMPSEDGADPENSLTVDIDDLSNQGAGN